MHKLQIEKLQEFRKLLHKYPEISGHENETSGRISKFLEYLNPDEIIKDIGGFGIAYVFDSKIPGPTVLIRADIDALPIKEINNLLYVSENQGVAHLCGHDGHTVILCGLAELVNENRPVRGKLVLLFQPAEETGQGAKSVIQDARFDKIKPDFSFALHNLPGFTKNSVCIKKGVFASASTGVIVELKGKPSHAAYPENGNNPDKCIAGIITGINQIKDSKDYKDLVLATIIHIKLGEIAFGTSPGDAKIMLTIRSYRNDDMDLLIENIINLIVKTCDKFAIEQKVSFVEDFPATYNSDEAFEIVREAAREINNDYVNLEFPFRWSEDFGHFSKISDSAIFGIGAGEGHPQLHNENYDFPDEIIQTGISMFFTVYKNILL